MKIHPDLVVLASGITPAPNKRLFEKFKVPVNSDGFLVEAHAKLRPVDFSSEGIFLAGLAHYPKPLEESIAQAKAAVARAMTIISKDSAAVAKGLLEDLERGVTGLEGRGMFTRKSKEVLVCVLRNRQVPQLKRIVRDVDPDAFVYITDVREVFGEGFQLNQSP